MECMYFFLSCSCFLFWIAIVLGIFGSCLVVVLGTVGMAGFVLLLLFEDPEPDVPGGVFRTRGAGTLGSDLDSLWPSWCCVAAGTNGRALPCLPGFLDSVTWGLGTFGSVLFWAWVSFGVDDRGPTMDAVIVTWILVSFVYPVLFPKVTIFHSIS